MEICVLDDFENVAESLIDWSQLPNDSKISFSTKYFSNELELLKFLQPFDVIIVMRERTLFNKYVLEKLPNLKFISTSGARNAAIDLHACNKLGIVVSGTRAGGSPVVELSWALILALVRKLPTAIDSLHSGQWRPELGSEISGKKLGLVGLGRTGKQMAKIGQAIGAEVVAWSPNLTQERCSDHGVGYVEKHELFATSDIVSMHLVLSETTQGLIDRVTFGQMKKSAFFINTSRAGLCDYDALIELCEHGKIAGAALDVFPTEPLTISERIRNSPNMILTPHLGYVTEENFRLWFSDAIENINCYAVGAPIRLLNI
jgi:phosphoglycerate dehydrogenase-like enzyme